MKYRDKNGVLHDFDLIKGMSAYESAKIGSYTGTEEEFYRDLGDLATNESVDEKIDTVNDTIDELNQTIVDTSDDLNAKIGVVDKEYNIDLTPQDYTVGRVANGLKVGNDLRFESNSTWKYMVADLSGDEELEIKFRTTSSYTQYIVLVDENNKVIDVPTSSEKVKDNAYNVYRVSVPQNARKVYVSAYNLSNYEHYILKASYADLANRIKKLEKEISERSRIEVMNVNNFNTSDTDMMNDNRVLVLV